MSNIFPSQALLQHQIELMQEVEGRISPDNITNYESVKTQQQLLLDMELQRV